MSTTRDQIIAAANSADDLINKAREADPDLFRSLVGKALINSRTIWGHGATAIVSWCVTRYGLNWSPDTAAIVSLALSWSAIVGLRAITSSPINSFLHPPSATSQDKPDV